ncbi:MAG TPA: glycosyltransferase family 4 protein [Gemmatimonadaceae bacterium]|nr:glycosyltransferase family 4 protein [Gemmatimonadaceae bacterium]
MRILFVNDGVGDAGGVQRYLEAVAAALATRGHELALLHLDPLRVPSDSPVGGSFSHFCVDQLGVEGAVAAARQWQPAVAFSHNMRVLDVEQRLLDCMPVVKMMHGYFGTCVGGQKMHAFPRAAACDRQLGPACLALYLPRHCGQYSVGKMFAQYDWAQRQRALLERYAAVVVASDHMRHEYVRHGVRADRATVNVLFPAEAPGAPAPMPDRFRALFLGRMTTLKGGDVLVRAVALASEQVGAPIALTMAGDGPRRAAWESLSTSLGVAATFPGWVDDRQRAALYDAASVVVVPSVWPEPFGLTGLEGGAYGAAAVAFDVGGIAAWLRDGENGWLVDARTGARGLAAALAQAYTDGAMLASRRTGARRIAGELSLARHVGVLESVLSGAQSGWAAR